MHIEAGYAEGREKGKEKSIRVFVCVYSWGEVFEKNRSLRNMSA